MYLRCIDYAKFQIKDIPFDALQSSPKPIVSLKLAQVYKCLFLVMSARKLKQKRIEFLN